MQKDNEHGDIDVMNYLMKLNEFIIQYDDLLINIHSFDIYFILIYYCGLSHLPKKPEKIDFRCFSPIL